MSNYIVTIYCGALDENPEIATFDIFDEAVDHIEQTGHKYGYDMTDEVEREQFLQYVTFKEQ